MSTSTPTTQPHRSAPQEKRTTIARWGLTALLGLLTFVLFVTGGAKVIQADFMVTNMAELHFGKAATIAVGVLELFAGIGLWAKRYRTLALAVFLLLLAGGAGAHWGFGHPPSRVVPPFVLASLTFSALWLDRGRDLWDFVLRR